MDWQVVAPVLHFLPVFLFQVPLHHPTNMATSQKLHPLNQSSLFCDSFCVHQFYLLPIAKLPTAWPGHPAASHSLSTLCSFPEHTLLLSWGAESKQTCNSQAPLAAPSPVLCWGLNIPLKTVHEKELVQLLSPFLPHYALFLTLSYTRCSHHRWLFPTLLLPIWSGILHSFAFSPKDNCIALKNIYAACLNKLTPKIPWYKLLLWNTFSCYGWLLSQEAHKSSCLKICDLVWLLLD